jgi:uncharacterized protein (DUF427 family)
MNRPAQGEEIERCSARTMEGARTRERRRRASEKGREKEMTDKPIKQPGPDHPITVERNPDRVTVTVAGRVLADTTDALILREADYPPVQYVPLKDVDTTMLERSEQQTYCPYKGDASYYSITPSGERGADAVWTYETPYPAVAEIKDHVAIYPDRVDEIVARKQ